MPITPKRGSLFHADSQAKSVFGARTTISASLNGRYSSLELKPSPSACAQAAPIACQKLCLPFLVTA